MQAYNIIGKVKAFIVSKKARRAKIVISLAIVAAISSVVILGQANAQNASRDTVPQTFALQKTDLSKTLSASGVVKSENTQNVYTTQNSPVKAIFVDVGDRVKAGDVLAELDMSGVESDIEQAELNMESTLLSNEDSVKSAETSLESTRISTERQELNTANAKKELEDAEANMDEAFDGGSYDKAIEDARITMERRAAELADAERELSEVLGAAETASLLAETAVPLGVSSADDTASSPADGVSEDVTATEAAEATVADEPAPKSAVSSYEFYTYEKAVEDARINLERKAADLATAEEELDEALHDFDDYTYQNAINEAKATLEKRKLELDDAQHDLSDEQSVEAFDDYEYDRDIESGQRGYYNAVDAYEDAEMAYNTAYNLFSQSGSENSTELWAKVIEAETKMDNADEAIYDAKLAWDRAVEEYDRALVKHNEDTADALSAAERGVRNAELSVNDAQRAYDKAETDLERAQREAASTAADSLTQAQNDMQDAKRSYEDALTDLDRAIGDAGKSTDDSVESARNNYTDAQRAYEKALDDKSRAIEDYNEQNADQLESARQTLKDSEKQLEASMNSLASAEENLEQSVAKTDPSDINLTLQELSLEELREQLEEGKIRATADGMITEINATVGAAPSGIMFVIEDVDSLYVSANVKEYSLPDLDEGQNVYVTTDATGDSVYDASITYISPKAVSEAGSTSVEFEIRASITAKRAAEILRSGGGRPMIGGGNTAGEDAGADVDAAAGEPSVDTTEADAAAVEGGTVPLAAGFPAHQSLPTGGEGGFPEGDFPTDQSSPTDGALPAEGTESGDSPSSTGEDESGGDIRIGMNAFLNIETESREDVYAVPLSAVSTGPAGSYVTVYENGENVEVPVTVGLETSTQAEISGEGLSDGMQIVLGGVTAADAGDAGAAGVRPGGMMMMR